MIEATAKEEKALLECYRRLFKESTPSGDFDKLVEEATINEDGKKEIPFRDYEIAEDVFHNIVKETMSSFKIVKYRQRMFSNAVYLGCSPNFKKS